MRRVTVLMAVKDEPELVVEAIDSIRAQTVRDWKMLLIDDGSSDATARVLDGLGDPRIQVMRNADNIGLTRSLNLGLDAVDTELVARQDADDRSGPARFAKQLAWFDSHPEGVLCGTFMTSIDAAGKTVRRWSYPTSHKELQRCMPEANCICHGSAMFRADLARELRYREIFRHAQDYDLWLRMLERGEIGVIGDYLYEHRMHSSAISSRRNYEQSLYAELAQELFRHRQRGETDELARDPEGLGARLERKLADPDAKLTYYINALDDARKYIAELEQYRDWLVSQLDGKEGTESRRWPPRMRDRLARLARLARIAMGGGRSG